MIEIRRRLWLVSLLLAPLLVTHRSRTVVVFAFSSSSLSSRRTSSSSSPQNKQQQEGRSLSTSNQRVSVSQLSYTQHDPLELERRSFHNQKQQQQQQQQHHHRAQQPRSSDRPRRRRRRRGHQSTTPTSTTTNSSTPATMNRVNLRKYPHTLGRMRTARTVRDICNILMEEIGWGVARGCSSLSQEMFIDMLRTQITPAVAATSFRRLMEVGLLHDDRTLRHQMALPLMANVGCAVLLTLRSTKAEQSSRRNNSKRSYDSVGGIHSKRRRNYQTTSKKSDTSSTSTVSKAIASKSSSTNALNIYATSDFLIGLGYFHQRSRRNNRRQHDAIRNNNYSRWLKAEPDTSSSSVLPLVQRICEQLGQQLEYEVPSNQFDHHRMIQILEALVLTDVPASYSYPIASNIAYRFQVHTNMLGKLSPFDLVRGLDALLTLFVSKEGGDQRFDHALDYEEEVDENSEYQLDVPMLHTSVGQFLRRVRRSHNHEPLTTDQICTVVQGCNALAFNSGEEDDDDYGDPSSFTSSPSLHDHAKKVCYTLITRELVRPLEVCSDGQQTKPFSTFDNEEHLNVDDTATIRRVHNMTLPQIAVVWNAAATFQMDMKCSIFSLLCRRLADAAAYSAYKDKLVTNAHNDDEWRKRYSPLPAQISNIMADMSSALKSLDLDDEESNDIREVAGRAVRQMGMALSEHVPVTALQPRPFERILWHSSDSGFATKHEDRTWVMAPFAVSVRRLLLSDDKTVTSFFSSCGPAKVFYITRLVRFVSSTMSAVAKDDDDTDEIGTVSLATRHGEASMQSMASLRVLGDELLEHVITEDSSNDVVLPDNRFLRMDVSPKSVSILSKQLRFAYLASKKDKINSDFLTPFQCTFKYLIQTESLLEKSDIQTILQLLQFSVTTKWHDERVVLMIARRLLQLCDDEDNDDDDDDDEDDDIDMRYQANDEDRNGNDISPSNVSRILFCAATLANELPHLEELRSISNQLFRRLGSTLLSKTNLLPSDATRAIQAYAKAAYSLDMGIFDHLVQSLVQHDPSSVSPRDLASVLWACGKMIQYEEIDITSFSSLDDSLTALETSSFQRPPYIDVASQLVQHLVVKGSLLAPQDVSHAIWACGRMGIEDEQSVIRLVALATRLAPQCQSIDIANIMWGLSRLLCSTESSSLSLSITMEHVMPLLQRIQQLNPSSQEAANVLHACGKLGWYDSSLFLYLTTVLKDNMDGNNNKEDGFDCTSTEAVSKTLWAFGKLNKTPPRDLINQWAMSKLNLMTVQRPPGVMNGGGIPTSLKSSSTIRTKTAADEIDALPKDP